MNDISKVNGQPENIWIVAGPAGCGKSTVARYIADELSLPYVEGDDVSLPLPSIGHH